MHLTCDLLKKDYVNGLLAMLQEYAICNLFVILGEDYDPRTSDFINSKQLIKYIREQTGDYFCIGVAGFPDHSDDKIMHLKDKIQSGADFIITQAFFEFDDYKTFLSRCENLGIEVPIIPGIFLFENLKELTGFTNLCKVQVSKKLLKNIEEETNKSGANVVKELIQNINRSCYGPVNYHFFSLNKLSRLECFVTNVKVLKNYI